MATVDSVTVTKFHLSLNVSDLARSVAFYRALFDLEPAKLRHDYAKFELTDPPVVLSLVPSSQAQGGALNHLGVRVPDAATLVAMQARLEAAGMTTQREEGVKCCYSRQTKFWIADPDRNLWEIYILLDAGQEHDAEQHDHPQVAAPATSEAPATPAAGPAFWQHFLTSPLPERIPHDDATLDEVRLEGGFNMLVDETTFAAFLQEIRRVLKPGGRVFVHGLVADRRFPGKMPTLPGPAAWVSYVPLEAEPIEKLVAAGFVGVQYTKLAEKPNFTVEGVELRELKLSGVQPGAAAAKSGGIVLYKGPHARITDESGRVYPRGQRVEVDACTHAALKAGPTAEQFIFLAAAESLPMMGCCS